MTKDEFIMRTIGRVTWKKYAADWDHMDCFGLVQMYYRHVLGIETTWGETLNDWKEQGWEELEHPADGACAFICWRGSIPEHAGLYIGNGMLLHCDGTEYKTGGVRINSVKSINQIYGTVKFYAYNPA